jgi:amino acid adenylation domain-containing protein
VSLEPCENPGAATLAQDPAAQPAHVNGTAPERDRRTCLHHLFEVQAARSPDAAAVLFETEEVSYAELDQRAQRLALRLRRLGVGPDVLVGICLDRSVELVVGLLAILKAGGAYVPLDPEYPRDRLEYMLEDSGLGVLLTQQRLLDLLPRAPVRLCLDASREAAALDDAARPPAMVHADNLAYVIYTSGSTGRPKGAMNTHAAIVNRLLWMQQAYRLDGTDRVLQKTPASFDVSVWEFFWPLLSGAGLVLARPGSHRDAAYLAQVIQQRSVTTIHFVPSMLRAFLEHPGASECRSLRRVIASGEALAADLQRRFFERSDAELHNLYGPTETAVDVTYWRCRRDAGADRVPIGGPISNAYVRILDPALRPVTAGGVGELHIGGLPVGRGYWGRPELTAERFVPDPCGDQPGARLYKSGDLARWGPDGALEYLGRLDDQVKLRGFRIELGEIETVLAEYPGVARSVVAARDFEGDSRLVAYVVKSDPRLESGALKQFLRAKLPEYMVPSHVVFLEALPLGPSGKLDRRALPDPPERHDAAGAYVAPGTPREHALAEIWCDVLGARSVGRHDDFFELGGHSLLVLKVLSRARDRWGLELPQELLFEHPTLAAMAARIDAGAGDEAWPPLLPVPREGPLPLSFPQEQAWFMQQLEPGNLAYQSQTVLRFDGPLDVRALASALEELVRRHEILRTSFPSVDGKPAQVVHAPWSVSVPVEDLRDVPQPERENAAQQIVDSFVRRSFELDRLPLIRWRLLRLGDARHWLVHSEHHLVHDGWSFTVFLRELTVLYRDFAAGRPASLAQPALQFADFAVWQRQALQGARGDAQRVYWTRRLAGAPPLLDLPGDRPRPRRQSFRGAAPRFELPHGLLDGLKQASRREGATLFMTMLAVFLALLRRYTGQDDLCVGSGVANRRWRETEALLGMIVNTVAVRVDASGDPTFRELLRRVKESVLSASAQQDLPFGSVVEALNPDRSLSHPPIYQVLFSFHDTPVDGLDLGGVTLTAQEAVSNGSAKFDMNVIVVPRPERLAGAGATDPQPGTLIWEYSSDLYDGATIERMAGHYATLLRGVLAAPDTRISELPLLDERERAKLLDEFNATAKPYPGDRCIHELFEEQAAATPERPALQCGAERLSYAALDARAEGLARRLRGLGVGPEVRVGVCAERSPATIVALLAVLKAGGAYVPLEPGYPEERLRFMLEDAGVRVLLCDGHAPRGLAGPEHVELRLDDAEPAPPGPPGRERPARPDPDGLAYVMYTSGSTGRPKGVLVTHRGVVRLVKGSDCARLGPDETLLQFAPLSFDASTFEIWGSLLNGARLVIMPAGAASLDELAETIRAAGVTTLWLTSGLFNELVEARLHALSGVGQILAGGDVLSAAHVERALSGLPGCRVINGYGPTESTTFAACHPMRPGRRVDPSVPIGRPIANTLAYVLDERMRPAPIGVAGDLYLGGAGLARGYLGRPELTAECFVPDPFGRGTRLYRTGDRARFLRDGRLAFLGRRDDQVKMRGFRIEPGEVENVLDRHPDVAKAAIVARPDEAGERRLVAYVVPRESTSPTPASLRGWLAERLPEYLLPSLYVPLGALPLTPNGKLDRRALPEPTPDGEVLEPAPPRTPTEESVREIFADVLGRSRIGIQQSFFELGGHSLKAARLMARVNDAFGVTIPLRALFEHPTVAGVASQVDAALAQGAGAAPRPIAPSPRRRSAAPPVAAPVPDPGPREGGR